MHRFPRVAFFALSCVLLLSACHSLPDHVRYIPKDALVVVGLHTNEIKKKVAWSAVTGSRMLDDLRSNPKAAAAVKDIENSGIDFGNTLYFYTKQDNRFEGAAKVAAVVPLSDAKKWEAYARKVFPGAVIKKVKDRTEASLDGKAYAGWNDDVLIVMNTVNRAVRHEAAPDTAGGFPDAFGFNEMVPDTAATATEMDAAFNLPKDASIAGNDRFSKSERDGHDITMWMSYDAMMNSNSAKQGMGMLGVSLNSALWKNSAMAAGFDFKDGRIEGDMLYYASDSLKDIAKEFGKQNVDKDMLSRLPGQNLNLLAGYHLSPAAIKMMLDKLGFTGYANMFLMQKNTTIDSVLNAFTGDMVVAVNKFSMNAPQMPGDTGMQGGMSAYPSYEQKMEYVYAMKINNKASFDKLFRMVSEAAGLQPSATNTYSIPLSGTQSLHMVVGDKYFALSNNAASAQAFLTGKSGDMPEVARKEVDGHPAGVYVDVQSFLQGMNPMMRASGSDSVALAEMRNLLSNATMNGGEFEGAASRYHLSVNFVNKNENSLLQLLHLAQRIQAAHGNAVASNN